MEGCHGIDSEVFMSLPAVLGSDGVTKIVTQNLTEEETKALQESAKTLEEIQKTLDI